MSDAKIQTHQTVKTIDELAPLLGCTRTWFFQIKKRFGTFPDWPTPIKRQYDVAAFQNFWKTHNLRTAAERFADQTADENLTAELKRRDLTLRDLAIDEKRRLLIPRADHERDMIALCHIFSNGLTALDEYVSAIGLPAASVAQIKTRVADLRATVERQVRTSGFDDGINTDAP